MNRRVLFVDDESGVLQGIRRNLHKQFDVHGETDPTIALDLIRTQEAFAVVVSDMRMPGMDGIEFLSQVRKLSPMTVRLMLTGNADQSTAIQAVNRGEVFKFLTKPCESIVLERVIEMSVQQYELAYAEKDILDRTVRGSVAALTEILAIANPTVFGRVERLRKLALDAAERLDDADPWELDTATVLSQIGCVNSPSAILEKIAVGATLDATERAAYCAHAVLGAELVRKIPRLEGVAAAILYQFKNYDGSGYPEGPVSGDDIPLSARILRVVLQYDELKSLEPSGTTALELLLERRTHFDQRVLRAFAASVGDIPVTETVQVNADKLEFGMQIEQDVLTDDGVLLVCRGQEVTTTIRQHLQNFYASDRLTRPILVTV